MDTGNFISRFGFGLLFIWGGLEKFFEGFLGGVGLEAVAGLLEGSGLGFLGHTTLYLLASALAAFELLAGILLLMRQQLVYAYGILAFFMLNALVLVHLPSGNWLMIMIHVALFLALAGRSVAAYQAERTPGTEERLSVVRA